MRVSLDLLQMIPFIGSVAVFAATSICQMLSFVCTWNWLRSEQIRTVWMVSGLVFVGTLLGALVSAHLAVALTVVIGLAGAVYPKHETKGVIPASAVIVTLVSILLVAGAGDIETARSYRSSVESVRRGCVELQAQGINCSIHPFWGTMDYVPRILNEPYAALLAGLGLLAPLVVILAGVRRPTAYVIAAVVLPAISLLLFTTVSYLAGMNGLPALTLREGWPNAPMLHVTWNSLGAQIAYSLYIVQACFYSWRWKQPGLFVLALAMAGIAWNQWMVFP